MPENASSEPAALPDPRVRPVYIGSELYRASTYGPKHPLAIPRVTTCTDLCRAMGWLPDAQYVTAPMAEPADVLRFHDAGYLAALERAEAAQSVSAEDRERYRIGADGNPVSCREKLKVLAENHAELAQVMRDAFEDAVLMGVDEAAMRRILEELVAGLPSPKRPAR